MFAKIKNLLMVKYFSSVCILATVACFDLSMNIVNILSIMCSHSDRWCFTLIKYKKKQMCYMDSLSPEPAVTKTACTSLQHSEPCNSSFDI